MYIVLRITELNKCDSFHLTSPALLLSLRVFLFATEHEITVSLMVYSSVPEAQGLGGWGARQDYLRLLCMKWHSGSEAGCQDGEESGLSGCSLVSLCAGLSG